MREELRKVYSQNFIKSSQLVNDLVRRSNIVNSDIVFDIGAGSGMITVELSKHAKYVFGIEIDKSLIPKLKKNVGLLRNVCIINADILKYELPKGFSYKVFSNIPFNFSGKIIKKLLFNCNPPSALYLVLEYGVWKKYSGSPRETKVSLFLKPIYEMKLVHYFNRFDFKPVSNVQVVFIEILRKEKAVFTPQEYSDYCKFVSYGLSQQKPNVQKCFKDVFTYEQMKHLSKDFKFRMKGPVSDLSYDNWLNLFKFYNKNVDEKKKVDIINFAEKTELV